MKTWYIYTTECYSAMKKSKIRKMDGSREYNIKQGDLNSERQKLHVLAHMQTLAYNVYV